MSPSYKLARNRARSRSGIALVLVLSMLVLLSVVLVAFMTSATTETAASKAASYQMESRQAADAAVNMVIGQIRDATTGIEDGASPDSAKGDLGFSWASQPGAIRTFGQSGNTVYKLYSAEVMRESEASYATSALTDAASGVTDPEENGYVDLNEPSLTPAEGTDPADQLYEPQYPIVNPYGKFAYSQSTGKFNLGATPQPGEGAIEGFYSEDIRDEERKDADGNPLPLLPMRVKWIYLLKDGAFAPVDSAGKIKGATAENPAVARVAFWTDDESSKININTATEGTYWDVPSVGTLQESGDANGPGFVSHINGTSMNLAVSQPARNEWQRYPGHPATTSLSPALRWLFPKYRYPMPSDDPDWEFKESIYRMAPRVVGGKEGRNPDGKMHNGTTLGGIYNTDRPNTNIETAVPISADRERLYATLDEYFFRPDRTARNLPVRYDAYAGQEKPNVQFRPEHVEKLRFFLTANSRTPELNLFGRPRVTIWPVHADEAKQTAFDDIFAFASTLGNRDYFFTRRDPRSATADFTG
ncbi:MAG: Verru_Chthon cassette protein A, partial [Verrucomicrobiaceae bacterium]